MIPCLNLKHLPYRSTPMNSIIDCHTHHQHATDAIINIDDFKGVLEHDLLYSAGIHPWRAENASEGSFSTVEMLSQLNCVVAIGECGIDKAISTPLSVQQEIFIKHIHLSEKVKKPLIIHCVRAWQELIGIHKQFKPSQAWIIHGFRGKPTIAENLVINGLFISYGHHFNAESIKITPLHHILIETDECRQPIIQLASAIAEVRGISTESLLAAVSLNIQSCLG